MSRLRTLVSILALCGTICARGQHTMVMHTPESLQEQMDSPCKNGMWSRPIDQFTPEQIGRLSHPITGNEKARAFFNQGLLFYYGFDTISAMQSFHQATVADPGAAMGFWGVALAAGGDLNIPIDDPCMALAIDQARRASDLQGRVTGPERIYIDAIRARYGLTETPNPSRRDPAQLSIAYMLRMRGASSTLFESPVPAQKDPDVAALYVVSLMNLRPWLWWTTSGQQSAEITEALRVLNAGLRYFPLHLGLNHFFVHAMEEAPVPQATAQPVLAAANLLDRDAPELTPHLRHMPAHIFLLAGNWQGVIDANQKAVKADQPWRDACDSQGQGPKCNPLLVGHYRSHDLLFLSVGLSNQGDWPAVADRAEETENNVRQFIDQEPGLEHYLTTRVMMATHFGEWSYVKAIAAPQNPMPLPDPGKPEEYCHKLTLPLAGALWYYGRTMAASATGDTAGADSNLYLYNLAAGCAGSGVGWGNNGANAILSVVHWRLLARIAQDRKQWDQSAEFAQLAVEMEDLLNYDEPPGWYVSSREAYGAALFRLAQIQTGAPRQQSLERAVQVFEADLAFHQNSSRSLFGRWRCFVELNRPKPVIDQAEASFRQQWKAVKLPSMNDL